MKVTREELGKIRQRVKTKDTRSQMLKVLVTYFIMLLKHPKLIEIFFCPCLLLKTYFKMILRKRFTAEVVGSWESTKCLENHFVS